MPKKRDRALKLFNFDIIPEQCQMINIFKIFDLVIFYNSFYTYKRKRKKPFERNSKAYNLRMNASSTVLGYNTSLYHSTPTPHLPMKL